MVMVMMIIIIITIIIIIINSTNIVTHMSRSYNTHTVKIRNSYKITFLFIPCILHNNNFL